MIFGANSFADNVIGMTQVLADNLQLKREEEVRVEEVQLNLADGRDGLPGFQMAAKVEITPVYNVAYELVYDPALLKKVQIESFYFRLGQEIRLQMDSLPTHLIKDQKLQMKKSYLRAVRTS